MRDVLLCVRIARCNLETALRLTEPELAEWLHLALEIEAAICANSQGTSHA